MTTNRELMVDAGVSSLVLYRPPASQANEAHWRINGYRATILIWTTAEWEALADRPPDAQYYASGVWCALRIDAQD